jgi:hypothetical protein
MNGIIRPGWRLAIGVDGSFEDVDRRLAEQQPVVDGEGHRNIDARRVHLGDHVVGVRVDFLAHDVIDVLARRDVGLVRLVVHHAEALRGRLDVAALDVPLMTRCRCTSMIIACPCLCVGVRLFSMNSAICAGGCRKTLHARRSR